MRLSKKIGLGLLGVFILIQFIQPKLNKSSLTLATDVTNKINVPGDVQDVLKTSCYDCHSNNTNYPWYSNIQPFGWLLARHIKKGKEDLNFSEFGSYSLRRQKSKLNGIANSIRDETMPLGSYTIIHKSARLSKEKKALLMEWATQARTALN
jgi:hypothetical protein